MRELYRNVTNNRSTQVVTVGDLFFIAEPFIISHSFILRVLYYHLKTNSQARLSGSDPAMARRFEYTKGPRQIFPPGSFWHDRSRIPLMRRLVIAPSARRLLGVPHRRAWGDRPALFFRMDHEHGQADHGIALAGIEHGDDDVAVLQQLHHEIPAAAVLAVQLADIEVDGHLHRHEFAVLLLQILGDHAFRDAQRHEVEAIGAGQGLLVDIGPAGEGHLEHPFALEGLLIHFLTVDHIRHAVPLRDLHIRHGDAPGAQQAQGYQGR